MMLIHANRAIDLIEFVVFTDVELGVAGDGSVVTVDARLEVSVSVSGFVENLLIRGTRSRGVGSPFFPAV